MVRCEGQRLNGEWHGGRRRGGDLRKNPQVYGDGPRVYRGRQAQGHDPGGVGAGAGVQVLGVPGLEGADKMDEAGDEDELRKENVAIFLSVAARSNHLDMDHPDIQYGVKELCASMWRQLKQLGRYFVGKADMTREYKAGAQTEKINVYVDSDWAGDRQQRKSTPGGSVVVGGIAVNSWSPTQRGRSLSSAAEAEYYAIVTGAAEALAVQALAEEMGLKMSVRVHTDASAARAVACRRGLRKLRHIELKYWWVPE